MIFLLIYFSIAASSVNSSINESENSNSSYPIDCFKRISIGERLISYDVTRIVERNTVAGCEKECKIYKCTHFSFGVEGGNEGICELTTDRQISKRPDPTFDLYERTKECIQGKPTGYEEACYRRIFSGKRLHERFIRHSLPCNSLEACQHQCSIEKHFDCQGFNIRLDPARVGRGICELSSVATVYLDQSRDFVFDPEFVYYERVYSNDFPNCGHLSQLPNGPSYQNRIDGNAQGPKNTAIGGPYYGGDSYGPWSTGYGTENHGPWGTNGYGSGYYVSNNPSRGPVPSFQPSTSFRPDTYGVGNAGRQSSPQDYEGQRPIYRGENPQSPNQAFPSQNYPYRNDGRRERPNKIPTYIIIDADVGDRNRGNNQNNVQPFKPNLEYLPAGREDSSSREDHYPSHPQNSPPRPLNLPSRPQDSTPATRYPPPQIQNLSPTTPNLQPPEPQNTPSTPQYDPLSSKGLPEGPTTYPGGPQDLPPASRNYPTPPNLPPASRNYPTPPNLPAQPQDGPPRPHVYPARPEDLPQRLPALPPPPPPFSSSFSPRPPPPSRPFYRPPDYFSYRPIEKTNGPPQIAGNEVCFQRAHPGYRLNPDSIRRMFDAPTVLECEAMCTGSSFKCTGYSFKYSTSGSSVPNCLLTDFDSLTRETNLLPDRSCDVYFKMSACLDLGRTRDSDCFLKVASNRKIDSSKVANAISVGGIADCELACLSSNFFTCRSFSFRFGSGVIGEPIENCLLSDWPVSAFSLQDFVLSSSHEVYERGSYGHGCELDVGHNRMGPGYPVAGHPAIGQSSIVKGSWKVDETWRHFTVNGWPCRIGSECRLNPDAGFWYCEVEGGERDQWDYCCRPKHSCGYSRGYNYPWCYVGENGPEQWRPCSEQYYPEFDNRFLYKPVSGHNSYPDDSYGPFRDTRPWNFGDDFGPATSWPISYLFSSPPPNETYVWNEEEHHFEQVVDLHPEDISSEYLYHEEKDDEEEVEIEEDGESPFIKFKPSGHKFPYPKAIVQKLDESDIPKANDPEEEMLSDKSKHSNKSVSADKVPISDVVLGFSSGNPIKESPKNEIGFSPTELPAPQENATLKFFPGKRDLNKNSKSKKSKEVIKSVERIIENTSQREGQKLKP